MTCKSWDAYYAHASAVDGNDVLNGDVSLGLVQAVPTGLVERAKCIGNKTSDVELASKRVILEYLENVSTTHCLYLCEFTNFVCSTFCATADYAQLSVEAFTCEGVFTYIFPPDCRNVSICTQVLRTSLLPFSTQASPSACIPSA